MDRAGAPGVCDEIEAAVGVFSISRLGAPARIVAAAALGGVAGRRLELSQHIVYQLLLPSL
jgi:hypothetical protein